LYSVGSMGLEAGQFVRPRDLAFDVASGSVVFIDEALPRIQRMTAAGDIVELVSASGAEVGTFGRPWCVAVAGDGTFFVSDSLHDRVQAFDSTGALRDVWGGYGTQAGRYDTPLGGVLDAHGQVYVVDSENHRIQVHASDGAVLRVIGGDGPGDDGHGFDPGQFHDPHGIAVDSQGFIYVTDTANHRVQKLDPSGAVVAVWGGEGIENGQFIRPVAIAVIERARGPV